MELLSFDYQIDEFMMYCKSAQLRPKTMNRSNCLSILLHTQKEQGPKGALQFFVWFGLITKRKRWQRYQPSGLRDQSWVVRNP